MAMHTSRARVGHDISIETEVHDDRYVKVTLVDDFGLQIASTDGIITNQGTPYILADHLLDQYT